MAKLEHFALFSNDAESLKDFYVKALGLRVVQDNGQATPRGYFLADDAGMALEIIDRPPHELSANTRYICHVAFAVDDLEAARNMLEAQGRVFEAETLVDTPGMKTAFFNDPEGNRCQIVWRAKPLGG